MEERKAAKIVRQAEGERTAKEGRPFMKNAWRSVSPSDRYRLLRAAWRRETGEDLTETMEQLGTCAVIEIMFDFAEKNDGAAWPKAKLKHLKQIALIA